MNKTQNAVSVFEINQITVNENQIHAQVFINKESIIYDAHFPGDPITPGICQLQLVQDIFCEAFPQYNAQLQHAKQIKYVDVLRPTLYNQVEVHIGYHISEELAHIDASIFNMNIVFFKGKLRYHIHG